MSRQGDVSGLFASADEFSELLEEGAEEAEAAESTSKSRE